MSGSIWDVAEQDYQKINPFDAAEKEYSKNEQEFVTDEQVERDIDRAKARSLSRGAETIIGLPGNILSFASSLFGKEQNILPTSDKLKKASEKLTGGYTAPQNEFEEKGDEFVSDVASMALPGSNSYSIARNIGIPVVGALAKEGVKYIGGDDKESSYAKMGLMIGLDLLAQRQGGAKKFSGNLFRKAEEAIPKGVSIDAKRLENSLNLLEKELKMGGSRPSTPKALEKISEIRKDIKNGKVDARTLASYRPSINETINEMGGFDWKVPAQIKSKTIENLNKVKGETIKTLEQYGEKFNPEYLKMSRAANESWAAIENSNKISKFLQNKVGYTPKSSAAQALFSYSPKLLNVGAAVASPLTLATTATLTGGYEGIKILNRVMNSPTLAKYYGNVIKGALAGDVPLVTTNLKALDQALSESE